MFVGYRNNVATYVAETLQEIKDLPCAKFDRIETVEFAEVFNNIIYTSEEALNNAKSNAVRAVRNQYLETYVDPKQLVMVWDSLSADDKKLYADYRQYLLDYTKTEGWWEKEPMTLDECKLTVDTVSETEEPEEVSDESGKVEESPATEPEVVELYSMEI